MKSVFIIVWTVLSRNASPQTMRQSCGLDRATTSFVYEGVATMQEYPWMGTLYYDLGNDIMTTAVVLVTKQLALASAHEIDKIPKEDIRKRTRVVLGSDCNGPPISIREYTYHPEYRRSTFSALAMVQLETDHLKQELVPICSPPAFLHNPVYYAMTPSSDCRKGRLQIRKIQFLNLDKCKQFYRKSGLDNNMFWPVDPTCAQSLRGGDCVWRSGTALAVKQHGRWHLLGFGMHGPGCQSPARFVDYGAQAGWVRRSLQRTGLPSITRLAQDHVILRRPLSNVQRFGPCDPEETTYEMYMDRVIIRTTVPYAITRYNLTLVHGVEYSCVVFRTEQLDSQESDGERPRLHLRRWCAGPPSPCYGFQFLEIEFYVEIEHSTDVAFQVNAYGREAKYIEPVKAMLYTNIDKQHPEIKLTEKTGNNKWFNVSDTDLINMDPTLDDLWKDRPKI